MATKKKATPKKPRGSVYSVTAAGRKAEFTGQGKAILDALKKKASSASELVQKIGRSIKAPNPASTIAFYLCRFKADKLVSTK